MDIMEKIFLDFAEERTGTPKEQIKVINCSEDENGDMSGMIEIDGCRECIHEYIC